MQNQDAVSKYLGLRQHYSRQVDEELEQEDFLQAGEKAWGFLAAQVKAVPHNEGGSMTNTPCSASLPHGFPTSRTAPTGIMLS